VKSYAKYLKLNLAFVVMNVNVTRRTNNGIKTSTSDKKKSLGKLPANVREKMGFMKKGGAVKKSKMKMKKKK
jgi:hypothetical protein